MRIAPLAVLAVLAAKAAAADVVVLVASDRPPYEQALQGFQREFGGGASVVRMLGKPERLSSDTRLVVALGGKAALHPLPGDAQLVYGMAPGVQSQAAGSVSVPMLPPPDRVLGRLLEVQPGLKRLGVLWTTPAAGGYVRALREAAAARKLTLVEKHVAAPQALPETLRSLVDKADALWVTPDPTLVTAQTLETLRDFSASNNLPFYAPSSALLHYGAAASVDSSFAEIGRTLARAARQALSGRGGPDVVYPEEAALSVNPKVASKLGLTIPADARRLQP
jgi:putative ABC transport system substrate-binding protein